MYIIREFFTTGEEGSSGTEPPSPHGQYTHTTHHIGGAQGVAVGYNKTSERRLADERPSAKPMRRLLRQYGIARCALTTSHLWPLAPRVYHGPFTAPVGLAPTSSVSAPAPGGRPSGASSALHPPKPSRPGITLRPRREDKSAWAESNFSVTRRRCTSIWGFLHNCRRRQLRKGATLSTRTVHTYTHYIGGA